MDEGAAAEQAGAGAEPGVVHGPVVEAALLRTGRRRLVGLAVVARVAPAVPRSEPDQVEAAGRRLAVGPLAVTGRESPAGRGRAAGPGLAAARVEATGQASGIAVVLPTGPGLDTGQVWAAGRGW